MTEPTELNGKQVITRIVPEPKAETATSRVGNGGNRTRFHQKCHVMESADGDVSEIGGESIRPAGINQNGMISQRDLRLG